MVPREGQPVATTAATPATAGSTAATDATATTTTSTTAKPTTAAISETELSRQSNGDKRYFSSRERFGSKTREGF